MPLPDHLIAKLKAQGLVVSGPAQESARGWLARCAVSARQSEAHGIRLLHSPMLWIYEEEDGTWIVHKHEWIPGPGPTDFTSTHATAEAAVDRILQFFLTHGGVAVGATPRIDP